MKMNKQTREIKFRVYTEVSHEVLGMKCFDLSDTSDRNETVMQYTGLKDKNGTEIYENDICNYEDMIKVVEYSTDRVGYTPFANGDGCGCCESYFPASECEVIGNIYENKDLVR